MRLIKENEIMIILESLILNQPFFLNNSFSKEIIISQGFSIESLLRGIIGMMILVMTMKVPKIYLD